jgi:hypothetical protein
VGDRLALTTAGADVVHVVSVVHERGSSDTARPRQEPDLDCRRGGDDRQCGGVPVALPAQHHRFLVNPYVGLLVYIALPIAFLTGLLLVPIGIWLERRRFARTGVLRREWLRIDLNDPTTLRTAGVVLLLTIVNIVILSMATYGGVHYMDTVAFCGTVCHTVMQPQYVGHERGPHARLECVSCHVELERPPSCRRNWPARGRCTIS